MKIKKKQIKVNLQKIVKKSGHLWMASIVWGLLQYPDESVEMFRKWLKQNIQAFGIGRHLDHNAQRAQQSIGWFFTWSVICSYIRK